METKMNVARIMYLILKYGPLVQEVYSQIKKGIDTHPEHAELAAKVRHWIEVADDLLHLVLDRVYPELMMASFGTRAAVGHEDGAFKRELAEFGATAREGEPDGCDPDCDPDCDPMAPEPSAN